MKFVGLSINMSWAAIYAQTYVYTHTHTISVSLKRKDLSFPPRLDPTLKKFDCTSS